MATIHLISPHTGVSVGDRKIRIVELLPDTKLAPIQCKFHTVPLDSEASYEALSYTWGDSTVTKPITVDDFEVQVTANLESSLRHLRRDEPRFLWIDAICINQIDSVEKLHQVKMMGDIYKNAKRCLVWLGDYKYLGLEVAEADEVFRFFDNMSRSPHLSTISFNHEIFFRGLKKFIGASWWSRVWTVQEVLLPRSKTIIFGPKSISWARLENARRTIPKHKDFCCRALWDDILRQMQPHDNHFLQLFFYYMDMVSAAMFRWESIGRDMLPLANLWKFRMREAGDPRDKVLGILGLHKSWTPGDADTNYYTMDPTALYQMTSVSLIRFYQGLQPLIFARPQSERSRNPTLASWAIDWEMWDPACVHPIWSSTARYKFFNADNGLGLKLEANLKDGIIALPGTYIDKVLIISPPLEGTADGRCHHNEPKSAIKEWRETGRDEYWANTFHRERPAWIKQFRELCNQFRSIDGTYVGGGDFDNAFWRTILGDLIIEVGNYPTRRATINDAKKFAAYLSQDGEGELVYTIRDTTSGKALFATEKGYIGVGPADLKIGDELWVLSGGRVPFGLRKFSVEATNSHSENNKQAPLHFVTLGDCYVHGIMDGEAMDTEDLVTIHLH